MSRIAGTTRLHNLRRRSKSHNVERVFEMPTRKQSYAVDVFAEISDTYSRLATMLQSRTAILITTPTVSSLYQNDLTKAIGNTPIRVLDITEKEKNLSAVQQVCRWAIEHQIERNGVLVALGGGVLSDVVTTAASLIRRGIQHIRIPTTLVGQIDAGIGVKGAVNFHQRKGYLGCFYPPESVLVCPRFLRTLDARSIRCGVAEIIKMAVIADEALFRRLQQHSQTLLNSRFQLPASESPAVIRDSIVRMLEALSVNLYEDQTYLREVDFGHTFSPLIETEENFAIAHGEAVAIDIALSTQISYHLDWINHAECSEILDLINDMGLPCWNDMLTVGFCRQALEHTARHRGGRPNLVVPTGIGTTRFITASDQVSDRVLLDALRDLRDYEKRSLPPRFAAGDSRLTKDSSATYLTTAESEPATHLVLDVGGTSIRSATYCPTTNSVSNQACQPTPNYSLYPDESFEQLRKRLITDICSSANDSLGNKSPKIVSLAFAGPLTPDGKVFAAPTVWGQKMRQPIDLRADLQTLWPAAEITVVNDVTAAGYRFLRSPSDDLVVITVGSGIGNKTFLNGQPVTGPNGRGGEIGHIQIDPRDDAPVCECGGRGHLGGIASGRGAMNIARQLASNDTQTFRQSLPGQSCHGIASNLTNEQLVAGFHAHDAWSETVIRNIAKPLGQVIATIHLNLGIERFVIYGGFGLALGDAYRRLLVEAAKDASWNVGQVWDSMIELGATDGDSGLIGAGRAAIFRFATNRRQKV